MREKELSQGCGSFSRYARVPVSTTVALYSRVLRGLRGRNRFGFTFTLPLLKHCGGVAAPPQGERESPISAYGGDGAGCGLTIKGLNDRCLLCAVSPACGKSGPTAGSLGCDVAASPACGKSPKSGPTQSDRYSRQHPLRMGKVPPGMWFVFPLCKSSRFADRCPVKQGLM